MNIMFTLLPDHTHTRTRTHSRTHIRAHTHTHLCLSVHQNNQYTIHHESFVHFSPANLIHLALWAAIFLWRKKKYIVRPI